MFAVVGPVGSGTSEIAETLLSVLAQAGFDPALLQAHDVIEPKARSLGLAIPVTPKLAESEALQNAGDQIRADSKDNAAVAVGLIEAIRAKRAEKLKIPLSASAPTS